MFWFEKLKRKYEGRKIKKKSERKKQKESKKIGLKSIYYLYVLF